MQRLQQPPGVGFANLVGLSLHRLVAGKSVEGRVKKAADRIELVEKECV